MIFDSSNCDKILPALAKVKKELQAVTKGANNPFYKSKYADLNTYLDEVEPRLEAHGMILLQPVSVNDSSNVVSSIIIHVESGQYIGSSMKLVGDTDMQKAAGGVTYGRRYTLGALLSMKAEDDDGNTATGKTSSSSKKSKPSTKSSGTSKSSKDSGFRKPKSQAASKPSSQGDDW